MQIKIDPTPNPNAMKFTSIEGSLFEERVNCKKGEHTNHPLVQQLLDLDEVDNIFGFQDFLTVNKTEDANWDALILKIKEIFEDFHL